MGKCAGANDGPIVLENQHQPRRMTKRLCWPVVCRFLDTFDKDPRSVSALQHSAWVDQAQICATSAASYDERTFAPGTRRRRLVILDTAVTLARFCGALQA